MDNWPCLNKSMDHGRRRFHAKACTQIVRHSSPGHLSRSYQYVDVTLYLASPIHCAFATALTVRRTLCFQPCPRRPKHVAVLVAASAMPINSSSTNVHSSISDRPQQHSTRRVVSAMMGAAIPATDSLVHQPPFLSPSNTGNGWPCGFLPAVDLLFLCPFLVAVCHEF